MVKSALKRALVSGWAKQYLLSSAFFYAMDWIQVLSHAVYTFLWAAPQPLRERIFGLLMSVLVACGPTCCNRPSVVAIRADKTVSGEDGSPHGSRKLKGQDPKALGSRSWLQWPVILSTSLCPPKIPILLKVWRLVTKVSTPMGGIQDLSWR